MVPWCNKQASRTPGGVTWRHGLQFWRSLFSLAQQNCLLFGKFALLGSQDGIPALQDNFWSPPPKKKANPHGFQMQVSQSTGGVTWRQTIWFRCCSFAMTLQKCLLFDKQDR